MKESSLLTKVVSGLVAILVGILGWWGNRVQNDIDTLTKAVTELQTRARYLGGHIPAAPITTEVEKK